MSQPPSLAAIRFSQHPDRSVVAAQQGFLSFKTNENTFFAAWPPRTGIGPHVVEYYAQTGHIVRVEAVPDHAADTAAQHHSKTSDPNCSAGYDERLFLSSLALGC